MSTGLNEEVRRKNKMPHCMTLENRKSLIISGVREVEGFDDKSIEVLTDMGGLSIKGANLNIKKLNLELGDLEVEGKISGLVYSDKSSGGQGGFFSKLFK